VAARTRCIALRRSVQDRSPSIHSLPFPSAVEQDATLSSSSFQICEEDCAKKGRHPGAAARCRFVQESPLIGFSYSYGAVGRLQVCEIRVVPTDVLPSALWRRSRTHSRMTVIDASHLHAFKTWRRALSSVSQTYPLHGS
jgi:hypothetical protein